MLQNDGKWDWRSDDYKKLVIQSREYEAKAAGAIAELECQDTSALEELLEMRDGKKS